jgi:NAD(P)-dependent dehydrogenase (short-subunit alcohol dehydrogenase family)
MQGKVVLITGATGQVGRVVARVMVETGARVALTGRREEALEDLVEDLGSERVMHVAADLTDADAIEQLISAVSDEWDGIDILLNIAGGWQGGERVVDTSEEAWDVVLDRNLRSAFMINRAVLPYMVSQGWGRIVNMGSKASEDPRARQVGYNVAKAGVVALTASIAADYRRRGVAANAILPAIIDTPSNRESMPDADRSRWVTPEQIAELMLFLCSEEGGALNGASIPVYGKL